MMANMSNYLRDALGDHVVLGTTYTPPADLYVGLCSVAPDAASIGTEVTGGSYARQLVTYTADAGGAGLYTNPLVTFADMPAESVVGLIIMDAATGGNFLFFDSYAAVTVAATDTYVIAADTMKISFS